MGPESRARGSRGLRSAQRCRGSTSTPAIAIAAHDRLGLERLARYGLRAPFALSRLARAAHGRLTYQLKHPLDDGTTHLVFEPLELLEKLAVLVPPPPPAPAGACSGKKQRPPRRIDWAALLKRVFAVEIFACALCGGRMRVISVIEEGPVARKILDHLGLPSAPPVRAPARDPPDPELPLPPSTDARLPFAGA